jgi:hypothetical protein
LIQELRAHRVRETNHRAQAQESGCGGSITQTDPSLAAAEAIALTFAIDHRASDDLTRRRGASLFLECPVAAVQQIFDARALSHMVL